VTKQSKDMDRVTSVRDDENMINKIGIKFSWIPARRPE